jgi:hypothetical protein
MSDFETHQQLVLRVPANIAEIIHQAIHKNQEPLQIEVQPDPGVTNTISS